MSTFDDMGTSDSIGTSNDISIADAEGGRRKFWHAVKTDRAIWDLVSCIAYYFALFLPLRRMCRFL